MTENYLGDSLDEYVSDVKNTIEVSDNLSKGNTEKRVVEPFLQTLGWSLAVPESGYSVELDYGTGSDTVDYAFVSDGEPVVFVNTVGFEETLPSEVSAENILKDGFSWGVLTNGERYEFYRCIDGELETVRSVNLNHIVEHRDFLTYMSASSLESGRTREESSEYDSSVVDRRTIQSETSDLSENLVDNLDTISDNSVRSEVGKLEGSLDRLLGFDSYFTVEDEYIDEKTNSSDETSGEVDNETGDNVETDVTDSKDSDDSLRSFDSSVHEQSETQEDPESSSESSSDDSSDDKKESSLGGLFSFLIR